MKTCNILPYLVKNAQLLVQRHKAGTENWREVAGLNSTFMSMHESIDSAIKETKARIEKVKNYYAILDCAIAATFILYNIAFLIFLLTSSGAADKVTAFDVFRPVIDLIIGCCLAYSAYFLARFVSRVTGRRPHTCLVIWHVMNVFVHVSLFLAYQLFFFFGY